MIRPVDNRWLGLLALLAVATACSRPVAIAPATSVSPSPSALASSTPAPTTEPTPVPRDSPHVTAMPSAPRSDFVLHLIAEGVRWDKQTLEAPAAVSFALELDNRDGAAESHNFVITDGPAFADRIYTAPTRRGPIIETYVVPGLPAGTYTFLCTIHPDVMRGTIAVQ